jgi:hypothetical protein
VRRPSNQPRSLLRCPFEQFGFRLPPAVRGRLVAAPPQQPLVAESVDFLVVG